MLRLPGMLWCCANSDGGCDVMQAADLPWKEPGKLSFDLSGLKNFGNNLDSFAEDFKVRVSLTLHFQSRKSSCSHALSSCVSSDHP